MFLFSYRLALGGFQHSGSYTVGQSDKQNLNKYRGRFGLSQSCTIKNTNIHVTLCVPVYVVTSACIV